MTSMAMTPKLRTRRTTMTLRTLRPPKHRSPLTPLTPGLTTEPTSWGQGAIFIVYHFTKSVCKFALWPVDDAQLHLDL